MQISDNHFTHVYRPNSELLLRELEYERRAKERSLEMGIPAGTRLPVQRLAMLFSRAPRTTVTPLAKHDSAATPC